MHVDSKTALEIQGRIIDHLVGALGMSSSSLVPQTHLFDLGVDSVEAAGMAEALESWLGRPVDATVLWEHPTIGDLARYLSGDEPRLVPRPIGVAQPEPSDGTHPFHRVVNPPLARLLEQLGLSKRFVRGQGTMLYDEQGRGYLDFVSAYGALPLGHNPPEIWSALAAAQQRGTPNFVQPSYLEAAGELAARLLRVVPPGLERVTFANSGAEAVEAAMKMCRMATGRSGMLSAQGSFHGKTLGALSATGNPHYHQDVGVPVAGFDFVPFGDIEALRETFARRPGHYAAFLLEPIQGEGGVVVPPPGYLAKVRALCDEAGVPLVLDEVQTGLGRTGTWFACDHEGVVPDAMTLAKALGGGLMPIGAVVAAKRLYTENFGRMHSSTFAGGGLACVAGLAMLDRLQADDSALVRQAATIGARFAAELQRLASRYPHLVSEVRGRGLLQGLRFAVHRHTWPSSILAVMAEEGGLTPLFAGYMLNVEGVRVAPTLNGTDVIRLQPPLTVSWEECAAVCQALERGLEAFAMGDIGRVLMGIDRGVDPGPRPVRRASVRAPSQRRPSADDGRFAFVLHPLALHSYADFDPTLATLTPDELAAAARRIHGLASPAVVSEVSIRSATGAHAHGEFVMVGHTAAALVELPHDEAVAAVREAVEMARDRGARIVGLGAFTSIVTQGGLAVRDLGVAVTSGNSYTVVAAHDVMMRALASRRSAGQGCTVAVMGAGGAIGRAVSILLAEDADRLILVGNPQRSAAHVRARLLDVAAAACRHVLEGASRGTPAPGSLAARILAAPRLPGIDAPLAAFHSLVERVLEPAGAFVLTADGVDAVRRADAVLTATSATGTLLRASDLAPGAVICEISRPPNLASDVIRAERPDVRIIDGGIIDVPGHPELGSFGLDAGHAYACMAETMMLALAKRYEHASLGGELSLTEIEALRSLAAEHGFCVATPAAAPSTPHPDPRASHGPSQHLS
jgi:acetylornithine/succinyldiaminopimelate/putrescine aminotransferase/predicted amino acid dehydrogenase/acyl carrier protein